MGLKDELWYWELGKYPEGGIGSLTVISSNWVFPNLQVETIWQLPEPNLVRIYPT